MYDQGALGIEGEQLVPFGERQPDLRTVAFFRHRTDHHVPDLVFRFREGENFGLDLLVKQSEDLRYGVQLPVHRLDTRLKIEELRLRISDDNDHRKDDG
ncbi:hypothetical protein RGB73_21435 [Brevibacillus brevis]|uniref:Uncharacterized protein n=1 Tax=Brevibacillus brevis TaxID=1393 RepID=A0ABY9T4B9_BREBE|nr:hypothetical protein [Brevibacillus brevis]WNC13243.1 hypothetical protein RGB73_21435 [Brevibacillus brevis]